MLFHWKQNHKQKDLGQGAGDNKVAGGARKRLLVLIPPKAASSWWPTDDAPLVAEIISLMVVSVSKALDQKEMGMLLVPCLMYIPKLAKLSD